MRRTYTTKMRLYRDSDIETTVIWSFAAPDAKKLPYPTPFVSNLRVPLHQRGKAKIGEFRQQPLEYHNGKPQPGHMLQVPLGTEQQFRRGASIKDPHYLIGVADPVSDSASIQDGWSPGLGESSAVADGSAWLGVNEGGEETGLIADGSAWLGVNEGGEETGLIADGESTL